MLSQIRNNVSFTIKYIRFKRKYGDFNGVKNNKKKDTRIDFPYLLHFRFPYRTTMYVVTEHVAITRHVTKYRKPVYLKVRVLLAGPS